MGRRGLEGTISIPVCAGAVCFSLIGRRGRSQRSVAVDCGGLSRAGGIIDLISAGHVASPADGRAHWRAVKMEDLHRTEDGPEAPQERLLAQRPSLDWDPIEWPEPEAGPLFGDVGLGPEQPWALPPETWVGQYSHDEG